MNKWLGFFICFFVTTNSWAGKCHGKFINPITDICWSCIFPLSIGSMKVSSRGLPDTDNPSTIPCICRKNIGGLQVPTPGIPVGFWEPARMVDVTREPFCMVSMGGVKLGADLPIKGVHSATTKATNGKEHAFYHVHWYVWPVMHWLEVLVDFLCLDKSSIDVAWFSELDPTWNDDELGFFLNPESVLFANPIAQAACAADCVASSASLPIDAMFWCAGCQGGVYPFSGSIEYHSGGIGSSLLITEKIIAKLHRQLMLWGTSGKDALCGKYPMPIVKKSQYRMQLTYPVPATNKALGCHPFGRSSVLLESGREFPVMGEDFAFLIFQKKNCCIL